jgi:hypothetical protein
MQKATVAAFLLCTLLLAGVTFLDSAQANPYGGVFPTETSPPEDVNLAVKVQSPIENSTYQNGTVHMCFNVTIDGPPNDQAELYVAFYKGDWMQREKWSPFMTKSNVWVTAHFLQFNFDITNVPAGRHSIDIRPTAQGEYVENGKLYTFSLNKTITINFFVNPQTLSDSVPTPAVPEFSMASIFLVLAIASASLVYLKRYKSKTA